MAGRVMKETEVQVKVIGYSEKQWSSDWPPENLIQCMALFNEKLGLIPKEYRDQAQITIEGKMDFDDEPVSEIEIFYFRPLTIEEAAKMKTREEKDAMDIREHELEMLKHLTEKYKNDKTML